MKKGENADGRKEKSQKKPEKKECGLKKKSVEKTKCSDVSWKPWKPGEKATWKTIWLVQVQE